MRFLLRFLGRLFYLAMFCWLIGWVVFAVAIHGSAQLPAEKADAIIVLTGDINRINTALELLNDDRADQLFISGVHSGVPMNDVLAKQDISVEDTNDNIDFEDRSKNTYENALESAKWVKDNNISSIILVTSDYHMARAQLHFRHVMPELAVSPYPVRSQLGSDKPWWMTYAGLRQITRAYVKYLATWPYIFYLEHATS